MVHPHDGLESAAIQARLIPKLGKRYDRCRTGVTDANNFQGGKLTLKVTLLWELPSGEPTHRPSGHYDYASAERDQTPNVRREELASSAPPRRDGARSQRGHARTAPPVCLDAAR